MVNDRNNMGRKRFPLTRRAKEEMGDSQDCVVATLTLQSTGPLTVFLLFLDVFGCPHPLRNLFHIASSENEICLLSLLIAQEDVSER